MNQWIDQFARDKFQGRIQYSNQTMDDYHRAVMWHLTNNDDSIWFLSLKYFKDVDDANFICALALYMAMMRSVNEIIAKISPSAQRDLKAEQLEQEHIGYLHTKVVPLFSTITGFHPMSFCHYVFQIRRVALDEIQVSMTSDGSVVMDWMVARGKLNNAAWQAEAFARYDQAVPGLKSALARKTSKEEVLFTDIRRSLLGHVFLIMFRAQMNLFPDSPLAHLPSIIDQMMSPVFDDRVGLLLCAQDPSATSVYMYAALIFFVYFYSSYVDTLVMNPNGKLKQVQQTLTEFSYLLSLWEPDRDFWSQFVLAYLPYQDGNRSVVPKPQHPTTLIMSDAQITSIVDVIEYQLLYALYRKPTGNFTWEEEMRFHLKNEEKTLENEILVQMQFWCKYQVYFNGQDCDQFIGQTKSLLSKPFIISQDVIQTRAFLQWWSSYELIVTQMAFSQYRKEFVRQVQCEVTSDSEIKLMSENSNNFLEWFHEFCQAYHLDEDEQQSLGNRAFVIALGLIKNDPKARTKYFISQSVSNPTSFLLSRGVTSNETRMRRAASNRQLLEQYPKQMNPILEKVMDERKLFLPDAFVTSHIQ